jgi:D-3-phosphoglycerate dehydrogenase
MKKGARLLNFSRGELVNNKDLKEAIESGTVSTYIADFPDEDLLQMENVIAIPHLGASTPESEENCAVMAVSQLKEFLENGNITNSVNFPTCEMVRATDYRITVAHKNVPNMVAQISTVLSKINIANMLNKSKGNFAYTMLDVESDVPEEMIAQLEQIEGVLRVRVI